MYEDNLFTPMELENNVNMNITGSQFFINFLNQLEGWKTKCKNLHWSAPKKNIHTYLDEFLDVLSGFQDALAEDIMGVLGSRLSPNSINGTSCSSDNAIDFINQINTATIIFYNKISDNPNYVGIKSETETFIHNIKKYNYLFNLCDV